MMNKILTGILFLLACCSVQAQQQGSIVVTSGAPAQMFAFFKTMPSSGNCKQVVIKLNENSASPIPFEGKVYLHIYALGFKSIDDTINDRNGEVHNYRLEPVSVQLNEVVSTGQYDARPVNQSVFNTTVISRKQIEQHGDANLQDALMNQVNIRLNDDPILGSQIKMQGISGQDVKILIDGVPVIGRNNGNLNLTQLNLSNIDHIEVTQGPMSVIYGTDALGGVINLVSKKQYLNPVETHLHLGVESIGKFDADADLIFHSSKNTLVLNGGRNFFGGYPVVTYPNRSQIWKPREQAFGGFTYIHNFKKATVVFKSQYFNELVVNFGDPTITSLDASALDQYYRTIRSDNSAAFNYKMNNNSTLDILASYNYYLNSTATYRKNLVTLDNVITAASNQDTTSFVARVLRAVYSNTNPSHKIHYQTGIDLDYELGAGSLLNTGTQRINDNAVFGSLEWKPSTHTLIRPALRLSTNSEYGATYKFTGPVKFTPALPSLNVKQDLFKNTFMRWSMARGYRAPSLKELDLNFVDINHNIHGNPALRAENSWHTDLQVTWNKSIAQAYIKLEPMLFYNNIYDLITLVQTSASPLVYKYYNVGKYITYGFTAPVYFSFTKLNISVAYAVTALYDTLSATNNNAGKYTYTQEVTSSAGYNITPAKMSINLYYKYTGLTPGFTIDNNKLTKTIIEDYSLLDASLTKYVYNKRLTITAGVKNIFNVNNVYSNAAAGPHSSGNSLMLSPGRSFFVDMRIGLYKKHS